MVQEFFDQQYGWNIWYGWIKFHLQYVVQNFGQKGQYGWSWPLQGECLMNDELEISEKESQVMRSLCISGGWLPQNCAMTRSWKHLIRPTWKAPKSAKTPDRRNIWYCPRFRNPVNSPVEGSLSHTVILQWFCTPQVVVWYCDYPPRRFI